MDVKGRVAGVALPFLVTIAGPMVVSAAMPDGSALPQGGAPVVLDPADFGGPIDNPYWPMAPGSRWVYRESDEGVDYDVEVTVTDRTREIVGITAVEVHDRLTVGGAVVEDTLDWYAQDSAGNIWYLGEDTKEYAKDGTVDTSGSWLAGVDGGQAGVAIPADPRVGLMYRQEFLVGEAEDAAEVLSLDEWAEVPGGSFDGVLLTHDYTPLEPEVLEYKLYAKGVGPVLALGISGGSAREELIEYHLGS